ncbi:MAG TPA: hypothetical protein DIU00_15490 [Phycisphaerales bacterium]|nr:hypothetical protein [Phycisphaerales bacterium]
MPSGNGWECDEQWKYQENTFTLYSFFPAGSSRPTARAYCRYVLGADTTTPFERFDQEAANADATIVETNQTRTGTLTIDWAKMDKPEVFLCVFLGTARLPDNRQLDIEVHQVAGDDQMAERVFKRIIEDLKFEDNQLLKTGAEVVAEIKGKGLGSFLDNQNRQAFFLIKDSRERAIGFTMDVLVDSGPEGRLNIRAGSLSYIRGLRPREQGTSFQCSNDLSEFVFKSEISGRTGRSGTEIIAGKDNIMTLMKFGAETDEKSYRLNPAAIPEVFFDQLLKQMLDSGKKEVIVDIIQANGKIIPVHISGIEVTKDMAADEDAAHVFMLELLDGQGFSERLYLDNRHQVYKRLFRQDNIYILERTDIGSIMEEFPEREEYILQKNQTLK